MNDHETRSRTQADQDPDATQFVTVDMIPDTDPDTRRRRSLLPAVVLGVLLALALLAGWIYAHRERPPTAPAGLGQTHERPPLKNAPPATDN